MKGTLVKYSDRRWLYKVGKESYTITTPDQCAFTIEDSKGQRATLIYPTDDQFDQVIEEIDQGNAMVPTATQTTKAYINPPLANASAPSMTGPTSPYPPGTPTRGYTPSAPSNPVLASGYTPLAPSSPVLAIRWVEEDGAKYILVSPVATVPLTDVIFDMNMFRQTRPSRHIVILLGCVLGDPLSFDSVWMMVDMSQFNINQGGYSSIQGPSTP